MEKEIRARKNPRKRRKFGGEFKARVALAALQEQRSRNELASHYGVTPAQVSAWKKQLRENAGSVFSSGAKEEEKRVQRLESALYEEIGKLKMDNDWLKKKLLR